MVKIAICGTVRNCGKYLHQIFENIEILKDIFPDIMVIFSYDNCSDGSEKILKRYKQNSEHEVILIENKENNHYLRTVRIAYARNSIMDIINRRLDIKFHIMLDPDDRCYFKIKPDVILKYIDRTDWDCLTFNRDHYYDIWALQYKNLKHHVWGFNIHIVNDIVKDITTILNNISDCELYECYSAFNGIAIYRTSKFRNIKYDGIRQFYFSEDEIYQSIKKFNKNVKIVITEENCEHIGFHMQAREKNSAKIMISKDKIF